MIISKKRFNEEIEKAIKLTLEKKEHEDRLIDLRRYIDSKIEENVSDIYRDIENLRSLVYELDRQLCSKIEKIECKLSHKKKTLNE